MKMNKVLALAILIISLLAITVASQISLSDEEKFEKNKVSLINDKIKLEERQECETVYYNETVDTYGNATRTRDVYGVCFYPENQSSSRCVNGTEFYQNYGIISSQIELKSRDDCKNKNSFIVTVTNNGKVSKKEIDFSSWGVCIQEIENDCLAVICGSLHGGSARNGVFNGCDGGKTCQKFLFCQDGLKVLYKSARENFVEQDPTFFLEPLGYKEVPK